MFLFLAALGLGIWLVAAPSKSKETTEPKEPKLGGWTSMPERDSSNYFSLYNFLTHKNHIIHKDSVIVRIDQQVVAGIKYRVVVETEKREYREIIIWKKIDGEFELMSNEVVNKPTDL